MYLVGDADRERGLALLRRHYAEGRLSVEELADRADAVTHARTTTQLRRALQDLPLAVALGELAPRAAAAAPVARRAVGIAVRIVLLAAWAFTSLVLLAALGLAMLFAGASAALTAAFTLAWAAMSWMCWRLWRAVGARLQARPD